MGGKLSLFLTTSDVLLSTVWFLSAVVRNGLDLYTFLWTEAKKCVVCWRLDSFQIVYVVLALCVWTVSSSQFQAESFVNVLNSSCDKDGLWPNAFLLFFCILAPRLFQGFLLVVLYFHRLFHFKSGFLKEYGLRLPFGISFAFLSCRTEICCNLQLCSMGGTITVPWNKRHTQRFARLWYSSHGNHRFLLQFNLETLSLRECSRLPVVEI